MDMYDLMISLGAIRWGCGKLYELRIRAVWLVRPEKSKVCHVLELWLEF